MRSYRIVLDGETVGSVGRGETVVVETGPGLHELHLAVDWARSPSLELELEHADELIVRCWPHARPLLAWDFMTVGRGR